MPSSDRAFIEQGHSADLVLLTNESFGSHLIYFLMNSIMYATCLVPSTVHFFFTMIGASPAAFNNTSTEKEQKDE